VSIHVQGFSDLPAGRRDGRTEPGPPAHLEEEERTLEEEEEVEEEVVEGGEEVEEEEVEEEEETVSSFHIFFISEDSNRRVVKVRSGAVYRLGSKCFLRYSRYLYCDLVEVHMVLFTPLLKLQCVRCGAL